MIASDRGSHDVAGAVSRGVVHDDDLSPIAGPLLCGERGKGFGKQRARVINLSVGDKGTTKVLQAAIDYAYSKGVVIVVAAGNEGVELKDYGIAGSDKVLTIATTGFEDQRAVFSNWGNVSVAAPGLDILSLRARRTDTMLGIEGVKYTTGAAYVGEDKRYYRASGTSFSAPMVAGWPR